MALSSWCRVLRQSCSFFVRAACATSVLALLPIAATAQLVLQSPNIDIKRNGDVFAMARQADGKLLVAGDFVWSNNVMLERDLVRLNVDGTVDNSFSVGVDLGLSKVIVSGNFIYLHGNFSQVNGVPRAQLARVSLATGALDLAWNPNPVRRIANQTAVGDIAVDPAGNLYTFGSLYDIGGKLNVRIAKIPATSVTGQADPAFGGVNASPTPTEDIVANRILWSNAIGGSLFVFGRSVTTTPNRNQRIYRLDPTSGLVDTNWTPDLTAIDMLTYDVLADAMGDIYIAGQINGNAPATFLPSVFVSPYTLLKIAGSTGQVAPGWVGVGRGSNTPVPGVYSQYALALDGLGSLYTIRGFLYSDLAKFILSKYDATTGVANAAFNGQSVGTANQIGTSLIAGADGVFWGASSNYYGNTRAGPLLKVDGATGNLNASFSPNLKTIPVFSASTRQMDGRVILGGAFNEANGIAVNNLLRLNPDGSFDPSFTTGTNGLIATVKEINGRLYVGGFFTHIGALNQQFVGRINVTTGAADNTWNPIVDGAVRAVAGIGGFIYIQGGVTNVNGVNTKCVAKLSETTGALDSNFQPAMTGTGFGHFCSRALIFANNALYSGITAQGINGPLRYIVNGNPRSIAKIDPVTGAIDPTFDPNPRTGPTGQPSNISQLEWDGTNVYAMLSSGANSVIGGVNTRLAKLNPNSGIADPAYVQLLTPTTNAINDGLPLSVVAMRATPAGMYIAGTTFTAGNFQSTFVQRILPTGVLDATWSPVFTGGGNAFNATVEPLLNGNVISAGAFAFANGLPRFGSVAAISAFVSATLTVTLAGGKADLIITNPARQPAFAANAALSAGNYPFTFDQGSTLTLTVRTLPGWTFTGWGAGTGSASCTGTGSCTITLNAASSITATLAPRPGTWFDE